MSEGRMIYLSLGSVVLQLMTNLNPALLGESRIGASKPELYIILPAIMFSSSTYTQPTCRRRQAGDGETDGEVGSAWHASAEHVPIRRRHIRAAVYLPHLLILSLF